MSDENFAERLAELVDEHMGPEDMTSFVDQDMRSGGYFFDASVDGRTYTVLVVEIR